MIISLSERWSSWWEGCRAEGSSSSSSSSTRISSTLTLKSVKDNVRNSLKEEGFDVPSRDLVVVHLEQDLEPEQLQDLGGRGPQAHLYSMMHILNMLWQPILKYIERITQGSPTPWTSRLQKHQELVTLEMRGVVTQAEDTMPIDEWLDFMQETLQRLVDVTVPDDLLREVLLAIVPVHLHPTRANAMNILRCSACTSKLVGATLATQVSRQVLSEIAEDTCAFVRSCCGAPRLEAGPGEQAAPNSWLSR